VAHGLLDAGIKHLRPGAVVSLPAVRMWGRCPDMGGVLRINVSDAIRLTDFCRKHKSERFWHCYVRLLERVLESSRWFLLGRSIACISAAAAVCCGDRYSVMGQRVQRIRERCCNAGRRHVHGNNNDRGDDWIHFMGLRRG